MNLAAVRQAQHQNVHCLTNPRLKNKKRCGQRQHKTPTRNGVKDREAVLKDAWDTMEVVPTGNCTYQTPTGHHRVTLRRNHLLLPAVDPVPRNHHQRVFQSQSQPRQSSTMAFRASARFVNVSIDVVKWSSGSHADTCFTKHVVTCRCSHDIRTSPVALAVVPIVLASAL